MDIERKLSNAEIILKSRKNSNCYFLFSNEIIAYNKENEMNVSILIPHINEKVICFYDMYYQKDELYVIVATRENYDLCFVLDENTLSLSKMTFHK